jgi:alkylated DNA repair dioxygenase AlkB
MHGTRTKTTTTAATATNKSFAYNKPFLKILQESCYTPRDLIVNIGQHLTLTNDPCGGHVSSLVLVRLAKMLITIDNRKFEQEIINKGNDNPGNSDDENADDDCCLFFNDSDMDVIENIFQVFNQSIKHMAIANSKRKDDHDMDLDWMVDGIKAGAVVCRILHSSRINSRRTSTTTTSSTTTTTTTTTTSRDKATITTERNMDESIIFDLIDTCKYIKPTWMKPHQLTGLIWSFDTFDFIFGGRINEMVLPSELYEAYQNLNIPFRIRPGFLLLSLVVQNKKEEKMNLSLQSLTSQVDFQKEDITTQSKRIVPERRETAWQGEEHVPGFAYSGKVMERKEFSPVVRQVRDFLHENLGTYYDCCLLNLYPDGDSGMNYHVDPDQGTLWGYDTCVVSVGATRRFAFRNIPVLVEGSQQEPPSNQQQQTPPSSPHNFVVMEGDVTHMFDDCQFCYQHAVKTADTRTRGEEKASRSSLVFKTYIV